MWLIFRAEFRYVLWTVSFVTVFMIAGFIIYLQVYERGRLEQILAPLSIAVILQVLIHRAIEKRDRLNAGLPLDIRTTAKARVLLFVVPASIVHVLYFILHVLFRDGSRTWYFDIFDILMFFGLILLGSSVYLIQHDFLSAKFNKRRNPEIDILILLLLIAVFFIALPLLLAPMWGWSGNFLRVVCFALGWVSVFLALISFERRRSYLE